MAAVLGPDGNQSQFRIAAADGLREPRNRILKHGDTFAVLDPFGDMVEGHGSPDGLYRHDTRYLSHLSQRLNGHRPLLLSSNPAEDNAVLPVDLANTDTAAADGSVLHRELIYLNRRQFIWRAAYYELLLIRNFDLHQHIVTLDIGFGADFADLFEVRGMRRARRGKSSAERLSAAATTVTAAALANSGTLNLTGNTINGTANQATLAIAAAAPGTVPGDTKQTIVNAGTFRLDGNLQSGGEALTTTTDFTNASFLGVDNRAGGNGGSTLTIGGTLTNTATATMNIGNGNLSAATNVAAAVLGNSGILNVAGNTINGTKLQATLAIAGAATDTGTISLTGAALFSVGSLTVQNGGSLTVGAGATETGAIKLGTGGSEILASGGTTSVPAISGGLFDLKAGATVSGTITFAGTGGTLEIEGPTLPNTIAGLALGDAFDLRGLAFIAGGSATVGANNVAAGQREQRQLRDPTRPQPGFQRRHLPAVERYRGRDAGDRDAVLLSRHADLDRARRGGG